MNQCPSTDYTPQMYNEALILIDDLCILISNLLRNNYNMPSLAHPGIDLVNSDLPREKQNNHVD